MLFYYIKLMPPNGLYYFKHVLTKEEHKELIDFFETTTDWKPVSGYKNSRKVLHYGYYYTYKSRGAGEKAPDPPEIIGKLLDKVKAKLLERGVVLPDNETFNQCIVNRYLPGQGIGPHVDAKIFGEYICSFTIGSGTTMHFESLSNKSIFDKYVFPRSLYVMSGDARHKWRHSMPSRDSDVVKDKIVKRKTRYSITFRTLKET